MKFINADNTCSIKDNWMAAVTLVAVCARTFVGTTCVM